MERASGLRSLVLAEPPIIAWLPDTEGGESIFERFMAGVWEPLAAAFRDHGDEGSPDFTVGWYFQQPIDEVKPVWQQLLRDNVAEWRELAISPATYPKLDYDRVRGMQVPTLILSGENNAGGFNDLVDGHLHHLIRTPNGSSSPTQATKCSGRATGHRRGHDATLCTAAPALNSRLVAVCRGRTRTCPCKAAQSRMARAHRRRQPLQTVST